MKPTTKRHQPPSSRLDRRKLLTGLGSMIVLSPVACGSDADSAATTSGGTGGASSTSSTGTSGTGTSGASTGVGGSGGMGGRGAVDCALTPEQTEGPFYLDGDLLRDDITEGKPGIGLRVVIHVVGLPECTPLADRPVDIWHADHLGQYSGYPGQGHQGDVDLTGETFLRGTALTDETGRVELTTVYPGWYPGRAVHIHFKVHLPGNMEVTSQLYFPDEVNEATYQEPPYDALGPPGTTNAQDGIFAATPNNDRLLVALSKEGLGYLAELVVGVLPA